MAAKVHEEWQQHFDAPCRATGSFLLSTLRRHYPDWTVTVTPTTTGLLPYAAAGHATANFDYSDDLHDSSRIYQPPTSRRTKDSGELKNNTNFGRYEYIWNEHSFIVYLAEFDEGLGRRASLLYILSEREPDSRPGPAPKHVDELISAASTWNDELRDEILVFDQQMWFKDKELYQSVKSASWKDLILKKEMKDALIKDVEGFFDCRDDYKNFSVPWKRGIIFHGVSAYALSYSIPGGNVEEIAKITSNRHPAMARPLVSKH